MVFEFMKGYDEDTDNDLLPPQSTNREKWNGIVTIATKMFSQKDEKELDSKSILIVQQSPNSGLQIVEEK